MSEKTRASFSIQQRRFVMFDRFSEAVEKLATGVSRRRFLGSLGRFAGATALGMAGVLVFGGTARANGNGRASQALSFVRNATPVWFIATYQAANEQPQGEEASCT
jgi:hypothetical protein